MPSSDSQNPAPVHVLVVTQAEDILTDSIATTSATTQQTQQSATAATPSVQRSRQSRIMNDPDMEAVGVMLQAVMGRPALPKYDGSASIESFLIELSAVHEEMNENEQLSIRLLRQSLEGEAKNFFTQCLKEDKEANNVATVADWIKRLKDRFKQTYEMQYTELKSKKMKGTDTAAKYVDGIVSTAKSLDHPLNTVQQVMLLHENLLPKYKTGMVTMDPATPEQFKLKLGRLMAALQAEEVHAVDKLTDMITKVTVAAAEKAVAQNQPTATTLAIQSHEPSSSRQNDRCQRDDQYQRDDSYQRDHRRSDNGYRGRGGRGHGFFRGRGRGRGFWHQQSYQGRPFFQSTWPSYDQQQSYGYNQPSSFYRQHSPWSYGQNQSFRQPFQQQWQPRQQFQQQAPGARGGGNNFRSIAPAQQSYMIEQPATCPATPAQEHAQSDGNEVADFFGQYPENQ